MAALGSRLNLRRFNPCAATLANRIAGLDDDHARAAADCATDASPRPAIDLARGGRQYQSGDRALHRLSQSLHTKPSCCWRCCRPCRNASTTDRLGAEELPRAFRRLPFQRPRRLRSPPTRRPSRARACALDELADAMNALLVGDARGARAAARRSSPRSRSRTATAGAAAAAGRAQAAAVINGTAASAPRTRNGRAASRDRCDVRQARVSTAPDVPAPIPTGRFSPSAPPSSVTAACWSRGARAGTPAYGIWTLPGGVVEAGETLIEAVDARDRRKRPRMTIEPVALAGHREVWCATTTQRPCRAPFRHPVLCRALDLGRSRSRTRNCPSALAAAR